MSDWRDSKKAVIAAIETACVPGRLKASMLGTVRGIRDPVTLNAFRANMAAALERADKPVPPALTDRRAA